MFSSHIDHGLGSSLCVSEIMLGLLPVLCLKAISHCGDVVENCKVSSNIYAVILGCKLPQIATESGWNIIRWSEMHGKNFNQVKLFLPDMGLTLYPVLVWQPGHHSIISLQPVKTESRLTQIPRILWLQEVTFFRRCSQDSVWTRDTYAGSPDMELGSE